MALFCYKIEKYFNAPDNIKVFSIIHMKLKHVRCIKLIEKHYIPGESSDFYCPPEPYTVLPNNSPCDAISLQKEREQFESDFELIFGRKPEP